MEIAKVAEIRPGKRIVIEREPHGFRIRTQEHRNICGGYVSDANKEGWRDCLVSFELTMEQAITEANRRLRTYHVKQIEPDEWTN